MICFLLIGFSNFSTFGGFLFNIVVVSVLIGQFALYRWACVLTTVAAWIFCGIMFAGALIILGTPEAYFVRGLGIVMLMIGLAFCFLQTSLCKQNWSHLR
jgi:hypothetical protein